MSVEALRIDGDDLSDLMSEIETSFDIRLPRDLKHVVTAGDLHREIIERIEYAGGDRCSTSMVFYAVRRALAAHGVPLDARPSFRLNDVTGTNPAALSRELLRQTGWSTPPLTFGWIGCSLSVVGIVAAIASWWISGWLVAPVFVAIEMAAVKLDSGSWRSQWATLGELSRSIAALNHATLVKSGGRLSDATVWQALAGRLSEWGTARGEIAADTRLHV